MSVKPVALDRRSAHRDVGIGRQAWCGRVAGSSHAVASSGASPATSHPVPESTASSPSSSDRPSRTGRSDWHDRGTTQVPSGLPPCPPERPPVRITACRALPACSSAIFITSGESLSCRARVLDGSLACMTPEDVDPDETPTDAELTALALAADPDAPIAEGAVPIGIHLAQLGSALPLWYMPPAAQPGRSSLEGAVRDRRRLGLPADRSHGALQYLRDPQLGLERPGSPAISRGSGHLSPAGQGFPAATQLLTRASLIRRAVGMSAQARNRVFSSSLSWE